VKTARADRCLEIGNEGVCGTGRYSGWQGGPLPGPDRVKEWTRSCADFNAAAKHGRSQPAAEGPMAKW